MFSSRNKKNIMWIPPPICSYGKSTTNRKIKRSLFSCASSFVLTCQHQHSIVRVRIYIRLTGSHVSGVKSMSGMVYQPCNNMWPEDTEPHHLTLKNIHIIFDSNLQLCCSYMPKDTLLHAAAHIYWQDIQCTHSHSSPDTRGYSYFFFFSLF